MGVASGGGIAGRRGSAAARLAWAAIGAVVAARRPDHRIGWLFAGLGLVEAAQLVAGGYAADALSSELLGVIDRTVQPAGGSLWLRPGSGRP